MLEAWRQQLIEGHHPYVYLDGNSALMLVAAKLLHISGTNWGAERYLSMEELYTLEITEQQNAAEKCAIYF